MSDQLDDGRDAMKGTGGGAELMKRGSDKGRKW